MHKNITGWQQLTRPIFFSASLPLGLRLTILAGVLLSTFTSIILWNWQMEYSRIEQEKKPRHWLIRSNKVLMTIFRFSGRLVIFILWLKI